MGVEGCLSRSVPRGSGGCVVPSCGAGRALHTGLVHTRSRFASGGFGQVLAQCQRGLPNAAEEPDIPHVPKEVLGARALRQPGDREIGLGSKLSTLVAGPRTLNLKPYALSHQPKALNRNPSGASTASPFWCASPVQSPWLLPGPIRRATSSALAPTRCSGQRSAHEQTREGHFNPQALSPRIRHTETPNIHGDVSTHCIYWCVFCFSLLFFFLGGGVGRGLVCLPACVFVCLSVCLSVCPSVCLSVSVLVCMCACLCEQSLNTSDSSYFGIALPKDLPDLM